MKSLVSSLITILLCVNVYAFNNDTTKTPVEIDNNKNNTVIRLGDNEIMKVIEKKNGVNIIVNDKEIFIVNESVNGVTIKVGNKELLNILEENGSTEVNINDEKLTTIINSMINTIEKEIEKSIDTGKVSIKKEEKGSSMEINKNEGEKINIKEDISHEEINTDNTVNRTVINVGTLTVSIEDDKKQVATINITEKDTVNGDEKGGAALAQEDLNEIFEDNPVPESDEDFKGHWAGIEFGLNNYLSKNYDLSMDPNDDYMNLNTGRSWSFNINIPQYSFGIIKDKGGIVTGMGFEFNNYKFEGNNNIYNHNGEIKDTVFSINVTKSKLTTTYLTIPLLLEFQFPDKKRNKRIYISAGVIGGLKLGSHTKVVYRSNNNKEKDKNRGDFNLSTLRYGFTGRIGYGFINLYTKFYPTPLFEKDKGPELYPFSIGLRIGI